MKHFVFSLIMLLSLPSFAGTDFFAEPSSSMSDGTCVIDTFIIGKVVSQGLDHDRFFMTIPASYEATSIWGYWYDGNIYEQCAFPPAYYSWVEGYMAAKERDDKGFIVEAYTSLNPAERAWMIFHRDITAQENWGTVKETMWDVGLMCAGGVPFRVVGQLRLLTKTAEIAPYLRSWYFCSGVRSSQYLRMLNYHLSKHYISAANRGLTTMHRSAQRMLQQYTDDALNFYHKYRAAGGAGFRTSETILNDGRKALKILDSSGAGGIYRLPEIGVSSSPEIVSYWYLGGVL